MTEEICPFLQMNSSREGGIKNIKHFADVIYGWSLTDDDDLFVAGYHNFNPKTFLYHSDTREWEQIQDMPDPGYYTPGCAMVHNSAGEQEVIVIDREYTQIFNLQSRQWRIGK